MFSTQLPRSVTARAFPGLLRKDLPLQSLSHPTSYFLFPAITPLDASKCVLCVLDMTASALYFLAFAIQGNGDITQSNGLFEHREIHPEEMSFLSLSLGSCRRIWILDHRSVV